MPLPIVLARGLRVPWLRPDGKTQVTVCYEGGWGPSKK